MAFDYDVIIIGGGPAGLSAALLLARARRRVLVCDEGAQRNRFSHHLHGFITRDGTDPKEFVQMARRDVEKYPSVEFMTSRVVHAEHIPEGFEVEFEDENLPHKTCRKILVATGVIDELPPLAGVDKFFGTTLFHCPYCDAYEFSDKRICAYGRGENGRELALELLGWSDDVTLITHGSAELDERQRDQLAKCGIRIIEEKVLELLGSNGCLQEIRFADGTTIGADVMFFKTERYQKSHLAERLGCDIDEKGLYDTQKFESTNIPGLFVAGDASSSLHQVSVATASGAEAAFLINQQLIREQIKDRLIHTI